MKILLLGPIHQEIDYLSQKENTTFTIGQGQQSWVEALKSLGHEVFTFRYTDSILIPNIIRARLDAFFREKFPMLHVKLIHLMDKLYKFSIENHLRNNVLLIYAKKIHPDIIFFSGGTHCLFAQTIQKLKQDYACQVLLFSGIDARFASTIPERIMVKKGIIDVVVENDTGYETIWKKFGAKKTIVLPISGVDAKIHKKIKLSKKEKEEYSCDVCFVGTLTKERQEILKHLTMFDIKIWGELPQASVIDKELKPLYYGLAYGKKMVKIFNAAKIVLNFQPKEMTHGGNMRTFEIPGCGAFQLTDKVNKDWFVIGREIEVYKSIDELQRKISYFVTNNKNRQSIALAGYERAVKDHTYRVRFEKLIEEIKKTS